MYTNLTLDILENHLHRIFYWLNDFFDRVLYVIFFTLLWLLVWKIFKQMHKTTHKLTKNDDFLIVYLSVRQIFIVYSFMFYRMTDSFNVPFYHFNQSSVKCSGIIGYHLLLLFFRTLNLRKIVKFWDRIRTNIRTYND